MKIKRINTKMFSSRDYYNEDYYGKEQHYPIQHARRAILSLEQFFQVPSLRGRLLDVACGQGWLLKMAEERDLDAYGVDFSFSALQTARKKTNARLICCDVNDGLPFFPDGFFDYVACWGSLEHFESQELVVKEMARVCKPAGLIFIQVPNDRYFLHLIGYETDEQPVVNRYDLYSWIDLLETNGLNIISVRGNNAHLLNLATSSGYIKHFLKLILRPFLVFLPLPLSYGFYFLCHPVRY